MKHLATIALAATLCFSQAEAALVSVDWQSANDARLTLDTDTGLKWLDVDATLGLTAAQVLSGHGGWSQSFRYASTTELRVLFRNAGLLLSGNYSLAEEPAAQSFLSLFSDSPEACGNFVCGFVPNDTGLLDIANVGVVHNANYDGGYSYMWTGIGSPATFGGSSWGSFLVLQQSIPEPSTLALSLLGSAALLFRVRKQKGGVQRREA